MELVKAERVGGQGYLVRMAAVVVSKDRPDPGDVAAKAGYHPAGYGCYSPVVENVPGVSDGWRVEWSRASSCD